MERSNCCFFAAASGAPLSAARQELDRKGFYSENRLVAKNANLRKIYESDCVLESTLAIILF
jgi:uncharacterized metal-binding protein